MTNYTHNERLHCICGKTLTGNDGCRAECAGATVYALEGKWVCMEGIRCLEPIPPELHLWRKADYLRHPKRILQMLEAVGYVEHSGFLPPSNFWTATAKGYPSHRCITLADAVISAYVVMVDDRPETE